MNCPGDLTSRCFEALHVAFPIERARHDNTEVDSPRLISVSCMVIKEQVVSWVQFAMHSQERPHLIERRLPRSGYFFDGHRGPQQLWLRYFHHNIVFHEYGLCGAAAHRKPSMMRQIFAI
jgi:hypothetical protein